MNPKNSVIDTTPHVLIEGPRWADAEFYGQWLLAAAKTEALWKEAMNDLDFRKQTQAFTYNVIPDFSIGATVMLSQLEETLASITIGLNDADGMAFNEFAMMLELGFLVLTGERYQMVVPTPLDCEAIKMAALKLAQTEDEEGVVRPEYLVTTMPYERAKGWQAHLRLMDEDHRLFERSLLLRTKQQKKIENAHYPSDIILSDQTDEIFANERGQQALERLIHSQIEWWHDLSLIEAPGWRATDASKIGGIPERARLWDLLARSGLRVTTMVDGKVGLS